MRPGDRIRDRIRDRRRSRSMYVGASMIDSHPLFAANSACLNTCRKLRRPSGKRTRLMERAPRAIRLHWRPACWITNMRTDVATMLIAMAHIHYLTMSGNKIDLIYFTTSTGWSWAAHYIWHQFPRELDACWMLGQAWTSLIYNVVWGLLTWRVHACRHGHLGDRSGRRIPKR